MDWKQLNFQHLHYFLITSQHLSFTDAADELFISYSTLTKAIARLEDQLKVRLFTKDGHSLRLTKHGKIFSGYIYKAISEIHNGFDEIESITHHDYGEISISSVFTTSATYLPEKLSAFKKEYPQMTIYMSQTSTKNILNNVISGNIDVGFCGEFDFSEYKDQISREFIYNDQIVLIVNKNHPLADRDYVSFSDIKNETFVGYNESAGLNQAIRVALNRLVDRNFELNTIYAMNEESGVIGMVRANHGMAFVSTRNHLDYDDIKILEITDMSIVYNVYMVWQNSEFISGSLKSFKNFILSNAD